MEVRKTSIKSCDSLHQMKNQTQNFNSFDVFLKTKKNRSVITVSIFDDETDVDCSVINDEDLAKATLALINLCKEKKQIGTLKKLLENDKIKLNCSFDMYV